MYQLIYIRCTSYLIFLILWKQSYYFNHSSTLLYKFKKGNTPKNISPNN